MKKNVTIILMILSIAATVLALFLALLVGKDEIDIFGVLAYSNMWIFFAFVAIPFAFLVVGIILHFTIRTGKMNIISSAICTFLMLLIGVTTFRGDIDETDTILRDVEGKTGIWMPTKVKVKTTYEKYGRLGNAKILSQEEVQLFAELIDLSDEWISELSPLSYALLPSSYTSNSGDYDKYCLYIDSIGVFNPTSLDTGEYQITFIAYNFTKAHINILDSFTATWQ